MLRLEGVTKTFPDGDGEIYALHDVDLDVADGRFVAVMGPSGSGKTTLALVAAGVDTPTGGQVWLDAMETSHASRSQRAALRRRDIGVVFQHDELDPLLTVVENVALPLRLDGERASRAEAAARDALERCGVAALASRVPDQLSGGQRQRVSVARAVVGTRRLIVADEPTASVDTVTARQIVELLATLAESGIAVLMTTHDSRLAGFADDIVLMRDGRLVTPDVAAAGDAAVAGSRERDRR